MTTPDLFGFAMLMSLKTTERKRAQQPLIMTMLPGPAAQRSAIAAIAVTTQARDGLRRERRVATETVQAVVAAATDPAGFTTESMRKLPALRPIATDALRDSIVAAVSGQPSTTPGGGTRALPAGSSAPQPADQPATLEAAKRAAEAHAQADLVVVDQAVKVAALAMSKKGGKLTAEESGQFPEFLARLSPDQRAQLVS